VNTFLTSDLSAGLQGPKIIYTLPNAIHFMVYGFDLLGVPSNLFLRAGKTPDYENGIGFATDILNDNEIDSQHFAQLDLGDFIRVKKLKCADPLLKIGSIQVGEGFAIFGSNTLGQKGTLLYSYTNLVDNTDAHASQQFILPSYNTTDLSPTGDLAKYGTVPFRYISVTAVGGNVTLNILTLTLCQCS
jgi:hypothetical protein